MKNTTHNMNKDIVEFDDNNIGHVLSGPDYGQPWGNWNSWEDWYNLELDFEENVVV